MEKQRHGFKGNINTINIADISIGGAYGLAPVSNGGVYPINTENPYWKTEWQKVVDKNINTFLQTKNDPSSMITLQLSGDLPLIFGITVVNRFDCCQDYILGCELQVLDKSGTRTVCFFDAIILFGRGGKAKS